MKYWYIPHLIARQASCKDCSIAKYTSGGRQARFRPLAELIYRAARISSLLCISHGYGLNGILQAVRRATMCLSVDAQNGPGNISFQCCSPCSGLNHSFTSISDIVIPNLQHEPTKLSKSICFAIFDLLHGYWQLLFSTCLRHRQ